jgi:hypothetical protein
MEYHDDNITGLYVWGKDWISAKTQAECFDYLFEIALTMHTARIDWSVPPSHSEYLTEAIEFRWANSLTICCAIVL